MMLVMEIAHTYTHTSYIVHVCRNHYLCTSQVLPSVRALPSTDSTRAVVIVCRIRGEGRQNSELFCIVYMQLCSHVGLFL